MKPLNLSREEVERLLANATPGPWRSDLCGHIYSTECKGEHKVATSDRQWGLNRDNGNTRAIAALPDALSDLLTLHDRVAQAERALEPFADVSGEGDEDFPDDTKVVVQFGRTTHYSLTLGDFRRAQKTWSDLEDTTP